MQTNQNDATLRSEETLLRVSKTEAVGRWVGESLYWDIGEESISDSDLKRWISMHLSDSWASYGYIVAYHTDAFAKRREAISQYLNPPALIKAAADMLAMLKDDVREEEAALVEWQKEFPRLPWKPDHKAMRRLEAKRALIAKAEGRRS